MPIFFKQEKGLLVPPKDVKKWHVSWTLDNVLEGFKKFYAENNRWPIGYDLRSCNYLPNVKTLERKFGGITQIRSLLGLKTINFNTGETRSIKSREISKRGFYLEQKTYQSLVDLFHEPFVHNQARVVISTDVRVRVDFLIFYKEGKFAVDVFYPEGDKAHFVNNVSLKYKVYKDFPFHIYLCVGNEMISEKLLKHYCQSAKNHHNKNITLLTYKSFLREVESYIPLLNPYR